MIARSLASAVVAPGLRRRLHVVGAGDELRAVARVAAEGAARDARDPFMRARTLWALRPEIAAIKRPLDTDNGVWLPVALQGWIDRQVHAREPVGLGEQSLASWLTFQLGAGDCDCLARAVGAMAVTFGLGARVGVYPTGPGSAHAVCAVTRGWDGAAAERRGWVVVDRGPGGLRPADFTVGEWVEVQAPTT